MLVSQALFSRPLSRAAFAVAGIVAVTHFAGVAGAQDTPKPSTQKPGPTLTAVSAAADEVVHEVKKGDTLWDLANAYLKDPFRWPEVFRRNTDIVENPHWIYPGEMIRIPTSEVRPEVLARITTKPAAPSDRTVFSTLPPGMVGDRISSDGEVLGRETTSGVSVGEMDAAPFAVRVGGPAGSGRLAAAYDRPGILAPAGERRFQLMDRVFVDVPRGAGAASGDLLLAYRMGPDLNDQSQLLIPTGILKVISTQAGQPTLARVVRQFEEIKLDQRLIALDAVTPVVGMPVAVTAGPTERVLYVAGDQVLPSIQNYVILSATASNGVRVGDQFTLIDDSVDPRYPSPPVAAAVAEVVKITPFAVTAIVVDHEQPRIYAGMIARLSARAP
ncbi:MAG: LysM peptidoglycan-binding domain-containing protein [Gemmatimonadaceae bacterium]